MASSGDTETVKVEKPVKISWGYCSINPIQQVIDYYLNQKKKYG